MLAICQISICSTVTPQQIKSIGAVIGRWRDRQADLYGCDCETEPISLAEIKAGKLPKPELLVENEAFRKIQRIRLALGLKSKETTKVILIRISYSPDHGYENSLEELRESLPSEAIEEISVLEIEADEVDSEDVDETECSLINS